MIKFELSNGEIIEVPKFNANKISFFRGKSGFGSENEYDFTQISIPTMNVLFDYLDNKRLQGEDIEGNEELYHLADYLGDEIFIYEIRKQEVIFKCKIPIIILREDFYELPENADKMEVKDIIPLRKRLSAKNLETFFELYNYNYERIINETFMSLCSYYNITVVMVGKAGTTSERWVNIDYVYDSFESKLSCLKRITQNVLDKEKAKKRFLDVLQNIKPFGFEQYLTKEDAYHIYKELRDTINKSSTYQSTYILEDYSWIREAGIQFGRKYEWQIEDVDGFIYKNMRILDKPCKEIVDKIINADQEYQNNRDVNLHF